MNAIPPIAVYTFCVILGVVMTCFAFRLPSRSIPISSEIMYRTLVETAGEGIWIIDADSRITFVNQQFANMLGYPVDEMIGRLPFDFMYDAERPFAAAYLERFSRGENAHFDFLLRRKDGSQLWTHFSAMPMVDHHRIVGTLGMVLDISERKRSEAALRESEERYRVLSESTFDALIMHEAGVVIQANQSLKTIFGYDPAEIIGQHVSGYLTTPASLEIARHASQSGFEGAYEAVLRRKDGSTFPAEIRGRNVTYNGRPVRVVSAYDISERKQVTNTLHKLNTELELRIAARTFELQSQQAELNVILGAIGEGVFYSEGQYIRYANQALLDMTRYTENELVGKRGAILLDRNITANAAPELARIIREAALSDSGKIWRGETRMMRKDGTTFEAALTFTVLTGTDNRITGSVSIIRDITEEKRLKTQKEAFVANASHELRTPLTNIKMRLYLLRHQPEKASEHLAVLERVSERMQFLIEDLLDVSRFERGVISINRQEIVLQDLIEEVIQLHQPDAQQKNITLASELPSLPVLLSVDPDRLIQVIVNLVVNAINYTPIGGRVVIAVDIETEGHEIAVIHVRDTGVGIAAEHLDQVFDPFFRVNEVAVRGTGLGLSISKAIVELHGGSLTVESKQHVGSTFTLRLAMSAPEKV